MERVFFEEYIHKFFGLDKNRDLSFEKLASSYF